MGYALLSLAVLSISMMVISRMAMAGTEGKRMAELRDEVVAQASFIRAKIIACSVAYPGGDNGLGFRLQLPAAPVSGLVADLQCPGNPNANKSIWNAADGTYAPRGLNGLAAWKYAHDATSARIFIAATGSGTSPQAALNNAALRFGAQAGVSGATLTVVIAN